jgi:prefoldin subunit 5
MRSVGMIAPVVITVLLLLPVLAFAQTNMASDAVAKIYSDKESYLPNSDVTIKIEFVNPFTGTYFLQVINPDGEVVDFDTASVTNVTEVTYVFKHNEAIHGYGVFKAKLTYSGYVYRAGERVNVYSSSPLEITFTIAPSYSIKGVVVDEYDRPVAGVKVYVKETGTEYVTGADGSFVVAVPAPGTYTIMVEKSDYLPASKVVTVTELGVTDIGTVKMKSQVAAIMDLMGRVQALNSTLQQLSDTLASLSENVDSIASQVASNNDAIQQLGQQIEDLQSSIGNLQDAISALQDSLDSLKKELEAYATKEYVDQQFEAAMSRIDEAVASLKDMIKAVENTVESLQKAVSSIQASLDQYATKADLDKAVSDTKSYTDEKVSGALGEAKSYADQKAKELDDKIASVSSDLNKLKDTVTNLQNQVIQQLSKQLEATTNNAKSASRMALVAVILAIIGILVAIFIAVRLMKLTSY